MSFPIELLRGTDVPWDEVDPGIVPRLRILTTAGFRPIASCEGHGTKPWIRVEGQDVEALHRALRDAGESGYAIYVEHVFSYPDYYCHLSTLINWWRD